MISEGHVEAIEKFYEANCRESTNAQAMWTTATRRGDQDNRDGPTRLRRRSGLGGEARKGAEEETRSSAAPGHHRTGHRDARQASRGGEGACRRAGRRESQEADGRGCARERADAQRRANGKSARSGRGLRKNSKSFGKRPKPNGMRCRSSSTTLSRSVRVPKVFCKRQLKSGRRPNTRPSTQTISARGPAATGHPPL
ncbi:hypothetical protein BDV95DRAFT_564973 [Massariosphaeria phaeospora]|uniref:Uncharacterized protein n=1 Tax=Massariosphaeria phaeospora TaxID=100035 RepID=A0A7C8IBA6_9PLEO|nr:hypothetical protein BDV95DRAFT_564973 [Massariosphaeria phaeospora]